jgi:hypothetical protein
MIKHFFSFFFILCVMQSYSQKLVYKSNGNIFDVENKQILPDKVRELLHDNQRLLAAYNAGRSKKTAGNVLLIGGSAMVIGDVLLGVFTDGNPTVSGYSVTSERNYPSVLTFVGLAAIVVAIPVKIGFSKKIQDVVSEYNNANATGYTEHKLDFITNASGIGLRLTLN